MKRKKYSLVYSFVQLLAFKKRFGLLFFFPIESKQNNDEFNPDLIFPARETKASPGSEEDPLFFVKI